LAGSGLVLRDNGGDDLPVSANGPVTFATPLASDAAYHITVFAQPSSPAQQCTVRAGSGTMVGANVTNIAITCVTNTYNVGGTVSGLVGTGLVLRNNGGDDLAVSANGPVTFAKPVASGTTYGITVFAQPRGPAQTCVVTGGSGTMANAKVTTVAIACVATAYTVGGTVSGLVGSGLVLRNNGGDDLSLAVNGSFSFATPVSNGAAYHVTVVTQPTSPAQTCVVTDGTGTVANGHVTTVAITCVTNAGMGTLRVTVATTGASLPANYQVDVNQGSSVQYSSNVPPNSTVSIAVAPATYELQLVVSHNCRVTNEAFPSVTVPSGVTTNIAFNVTCVGTSTIQVAVVTTGTIAPVTYGVTASEVFAYFSYSSPISSNGTISLAVAPGLYQVRLQVPLNCSVNSMNPVGVTAVSGAASSIHFTVICAAPTALQVTASTSGPNAPAAYAVGVDPNSSGQSYAYSSAVPANGAITMILPPGLHTVKLLAPVNCTVTSPNNVSVTLASGATTDLGFTVACR